MTEPDYLPLAYLNAWEYCPRRFYLEYQLGEMADKEHILMGRHLHRNVDQAGMFQEGETLIHQQQWVWSDKLRVRGIEGLAAREYFACWSSMLGPWSFAGRNRRPPTDPVNALLSFAYGLLRVQVTAAVHLVGLDPYSNAICQASAAN